MAHPTYKLPDGTRGPAVTTVLSPFKDAGGLMHWAWTQGMEGKDFRAERDAAACAGTLTHHMIEEHIHQRPPEDSLPGAHDLHVTLSRYREMLDLARKGFGAFKDWASYTKLSVVATEVSLVCPEYAFGGTPDAVGEAAGELALLDWKSSNAIYSDYLVQVSAYRHLWERGRLLTATDPPPARLGEPVKSLHLLRVGKEWGDFHHHCWPMAVLDKGFEMFRLLRQAYDLKKVLDKAAK